MVEDRYWERGFYYCNIWNLGMFFHPQFLGPCDVSFDVERLGAALDKMRIRENDSVPKVEIFVDKGKINTCHYASELYTAFDEGNWHPRSIEENPAPLRGNGVWFYAPEKDSMVIDVYEQLWSDQPVRLDMRPDKKNIWRFWIKDEWPTPLQDIQKQHLLF